MKLSKKEACGDAECIALLVFIAGFVDVWNGEERIGGYSLSREWDEIPQGDKWNCSYPGNMAMDSLLTFYPATTR